MASLSLRTTKLVKSAPKQPQWGGYMAIIDPGQELFDPFIFIAHHKHSFRAGEVTGFPPHPHRGFETVTYVLDGGFDHGDSRGNTGRYGNGDVQWLTTGSGVLHSEMFVTKEKENTTFHGFQLWLNLPSKLKMTTPGYEMLWNKDIPVVTLQAGSTESNSQALGGKVWIKIIAGNIGGTKSRVEKSTPLTYFHLKMDPKSVWNYQLPRSHHNLAYVISGKGKFSDKVVNQFEYVMWNGDGDQIQVENLGENELEFLYLDGQPFEEPVAHRGPFVMNTANELSTAFMDFRMGKFGEMDLPYIEEKWARDAYRDE